MRYISSVASWVFLASVSLLVFNGCGNNVMGPTEPVVVSSSGNSSTITPSENGNIDANCFKFRKTYHHRKGYLSPALRALVNRFTAAFFNKIVGDAAEYCLSEPEVKRAAKKLVRTKLFNLVMYRTGLGQHLLTRSLEVLSESWEPGANTAPNGFNNPEVTLLPYLWSPRLGFYGDRITGWGNGHGYHLDTFNLCGDQVAILTKSEVGNIFINESMINRVTWEYRFVPSDYSLSLGNTHKRLYYELFYDFYTRRLTTVYRYDTPYKYLTIDNGDQTISVEEAWVSVDDHSAACRITSTDGSVMVDLTMDAEGKGGGTVEIWNSGRMMRYVIVLERYDHGYYTVNGGRPRRF